MRCVDQTTVSAWKAACEVVGAIEGKYDLSHVSTFQPTHAREIARAFRRLEGKAEKWSEEVKEEIAGWVDRCETEELSVQDLRRALLNYKVEPAGPGCTLADIQTLVDAGEVFGTVYADPPWRYGNQGTRAATDNHYPTMTPEQVAALPVGDLAADDAHLHLWTTNAFLFECPRIMKAWDFTYKSVFVWCKPEMGIGNYWRVSHEFLLFGVRGKASFRDRGLKSWAALSRGGHSGKPEQVRHWIERASPPQRLELFGRRAVKGWTVWGDEVSRDVFTQGLQHR
jgi:N6-adenosine-specific RNA methylase IME4